jgi:hypothetical protein
LFVAEDGEYQVSSGIDGNRRQTMMNDAANNAALSDNERLALEGIEAPQPEELLKAADAPPLGKAVLVSVVAHLLVLGLTSFPLYRDWARYGVRTPAALRELKKAERLEADKLKREAELKARQEKEQAEAEAREAGAGEAGDAADTPPAADATAGSAPRGEIDPADPVRSFELNEDIFDL